MTDVAPGLMGAGSPGYQGLEQQRRGSNGYEAELGLLPPTPPLPIATAVKDLINGVTHPVDTARDFFNNLGNLIFNEEVTPQETDLVKVPEKQGNRVAEGAGYKDAHDAKDGRGNGAVDIYRDKSKGGGFWIWNGKKGGYKERL